MKWLLLYVLLINLLTYFLYAQDKGRARKKEWRTPESRLLVFASIGGAFGAWRGMKDYYHKINKTRFRVLIPLFLALQLGVLIYLVDYKILLLAILLHAVIFWILRKMRR
ncbi:DUF1294 domain-containing protein [Ammoniphilus sp. CFH 90114]|uniref:DUF1294 domain-containing protein n=1 Tax=Ammoniphilus sp. CFH 90114 TaxID=2493665 RepID=UPI00100F9F88|nr:DUF1294 domain-containing protein [Ammoniphilus sp. CFH 90114]RXT05680.1 DUF1294 domain-containing protein [Ammoniphilus sp. CFH 90114]